MPVEPDKAEFLKLISDNKKIIFKICNSYCKNKDDRDDLAQEIIYQLWKSFGTFNPDYKYSTWMYRIALNVAISFYRKGKIIKDNIAFKENLMAFEIQQEGASELEHNINLLQQFINGLKELDKALMLLYLDENSYKEIAEILGISETNVATKISRIKESLKQKFITANK